MISDIEKIQMIANNCRRGLERLADRSCSMIFGLPNGSCGPAAEIVGRLLREELGFDGVYVCGDGHCNLAPSQTHAWYEVDKYIVDITYDQFQGIDLVGWVFERGTGWHGKFSNLDQRPGFCMPDDWPYYPFDGYKAVQEEIQRSGCREHP